MTLASLSEAITWLRDHWQEQRPSPIKLHTRDTEGIGPFHTPAMAAALDGSCDVTTTAPQTQTCYHPLSKTAKDCPECIGLGVKEVRVDRYVYPMSRALQRLHDSLGPARHPHPYHLVVVLAACGWDARHAAAAIDRPTETAEALFLMAIRKLHSHYSAGPVNTRTSGPSWIDKSESQKAAETAA